MNDLTRFNRFLSRIDVDGLREKYRKIKLVELDMPKNVQALERPYLICQFLRRHFGQGRVPIKAPPHAPGCQSQECGWPAIRPRPCAPQAVGVGLTAT